MRAWLDRPRTLLAALLADVGMKRRRVRDFARPEPSSSVVDRPPGSVPSCEPPAPGVMGPMSTRESQSTSTCAGPIRLARIRHGPADAQAEPPPAQGGASGTDRFEPLST